MIDDAICQLLVGLVGRHAVLVLRRLGTNPKENVPNERVILFGSFQDNVRVTWNDRKEVSGVVFGQSYMQETRQDKTTTYHCRTRRSTFRANG